MKQLAAYTFLAVAGAYMVACEAVPSITFEEPGSSGGAAAKAAAGDAGGRGVRAPDGGTQQDDAPTRDASSLDDDLSTDDGEDGGPQAEVGCPKNAPDGYTCCGSILCKGKCDLARCLRCQQLKCGGPEVCCERAETNGGWNGGNRGWPFPGANVDMTCAEATSGECK